MAEWIGYLAGIVTTMCYIPQILKMLRTRESSDISSRSYLLLGSGLTLWLIYGLLTQNLPVIIANAVSIALVITILVMKRRFNQ